MKSTKKALALILAVCMLIGMPLSINVDAASAPTVKAVVMPDDMADSLNLTRGGAILLYFSEDGEQITVRYYSTARGQYGADSAHFTVALVPDDEEE